MVLPFLTLYEYTQRFIIHNVLDREYVDEIVENFKIGNVFSRNKYNVPHVVMRYSKYALIPFECSIIYKYKIPSISLLPPLYIQFMSRNPIIDEMREKK